MILHSIKEGGERGEKKKKKKVTLNPKIKWRITTEEYGTF